MLLFNISTMILGIYLIIVYFEWDRSLLLKYKKYDKNFTKDYDKKHKAQTTKKVIINIQDPRSNIDDCLKSLIDQSVKVDKIIIHSDLKVFQPYESNLISILSLRAPIPTHNTIIIPIIELYIYPYDYIESYILKEPDDIKPVFNKVFNLK